MAGALQRARNTSVIYTLANSTDTYNFHVGIVVQWGENTPALIVTDVNQRAGTITVQSR